MRDMRLSETAAPFEDRGIVSEGSETIEKKLGSRKRIDGKFNRTKGHEIKTGCKLTCGILTGGF